VRFEGRELIGLSSNAIARAGIAFCPEERGIFASLERRGKSLSAAGGEARRLNVEQIFSHVPNIKERLRSQGTKLSGGEQQMLAIGRILRTGARLLLLDEPTEGLAPVIIQQIGRTIRTLKSRALPSCSSSRISASPRRSRTATTSWNMAASSTVRRMPNWTRTRKAARVSGGLNARVRVRKTRRGIG
jgi:Fe-S cluster assembly ATPase SufC